MAETPEDPACQLIFDFSGSGVAPCPNCIYQFHVKAVLNEAMSTEPGLCKNTKFLKPGSSLDDDATWAWAITPDTGDGNLLEVYFADYGWTPLGVAQFDGDFATASPGNLSADYTSHYLSYDNGHRYVPYGQVLGYLR